MGKSSKSWSEKYDIANAKGHEIKPVRKDMMGMKAGQKMLIATPEMVADIIAAIPQGQIKDTQFGSVAKFARRRIIFCNDELKRQ